MPHADDAEGKSQERNPMRTPVAPTSQERELHELTHVPVEPWCDMCVSARSKDDPLNQSPEKYCQPFVEIVHMRMRDVAEEGV